jgi:putative hemolysin
MLLPNAHPSPSGSTSRHNCRPACPRANQTAYRCASMNVCVRPLILAAVLLLAACSSATGHASPPPSEPTTVGTGTLAVTVSATCRAVIDRLVSIDGHLDPFSPGPPSGQGAMMFSHAIASTLVSCKSPAEWIAAASNRADANVKPANVLARFCRYRFTDRSRVTLLNAAACAGAPLGGLTAP